MRLKNKNLSSTCKLEVSVLIYTGIRRKDVEFAIKFPYKVGIVTFTVFPELQKSDVGAADKIKILAEDQYFDLLEVGLISDAEWNKLMDYVKKLGRPINFALGLQPEILVRKYNPNAINEEERKKAEEVLVKGVEVAGTRGMCAIAMCSGPIVPEEQKEKAIQAFIKTAGALAMKASEYKIPLYIETFDTRWDKKRLIGPIGMAAKIIEEIRKSYNNVYLMWDLSHAPLLDEKPEDLKPYADLIGHIHIGCAKRVDDKLYDWHPGFYRPGAINTEYEIAKLLEVLDEIKYKGAISFEVKPEEGQHPLEVVNAAKGVLLRAYQIFIEGKYLR